MLGSGPTIGNGVVGVEGRGRRSWMMGRGPPRVSAEGIVSRSWRTKLEQRTTRAEGRCSDAVQGNCSIDYDVMARVA